MAIAAGFVVSRLIYYSMGVRFDASPLNLYWQIADPALLRDDLWQSLFYLRTQLPGFDLFLGLILKFFPGHATAAFHTTYLAMGFVLAICLFLVLDRLRVGRRLAVVIALICAVSPITILYENLLFYEYPLAFLFCVAALFLHRYAAGNHWLDGIFLFTSLALLGLLRVVYHLLWFWMIAAVLIYALPQCRRRTFFCAAAPGALLTAAYIKSVILFGLWIPGSDVYGTASFALMTSASLARATLVEMARERTISPVLLYHWDDPALLRVVPLPPRIGIPILDQRLKSTGAVNMDSLWMAAVGKQLRQDGIAILRAKPEATLATVGENLGRVFLPADVGWPFGGARSQNGELLSPVRTGFDLVLAGKPPGLSYSFISYVTIPLLFAFGLWRAIRWLRRLIRRRGRDPGGLTIAFAFGNAAYLTALVLCYDFSDQNRILFEVFPLFAILLGSLIGFARWRLRRARSSSSSS